MYSRRAGEDTAHRGMVEEAAAAGSAHQSMVVEEEAAAGSAHQNVVEAAVAAGSARQSGRAGASRVVAGGRGDRHDSKTKRNCAGRILHEVSMVHQTRGSSSLGLLPPTPQCRRIAVLVGTRQGPKLEGLGEQRRWPRFRQERSGSLRRAFSVPFRFGSLFFIVLSSSVSLDIGPCSYGRRRRRGRWQEVVYYVK